METPVRIEFQGLRPSATVRELVTSNLAGLEKLYGRITACRVTVKGPGERHRTGGRYEVHLGLVLPGGRKVDVARTPKADERFADVMFSIHDAFRRTKRRLQDQTRKMDGRVKAHAPLPQGVVLKTERAKGFGFLKSDDGRDIYFHRNSVRDGDFADLVPGARVAFMDEAGDKGPQATIVRQLGRKTLRRSAPHRRARTS